MLLPAEHGGGIMGNAVAFVMIVVGGLTMRLRVRG